MMMACRTRITFTPDLPKFGMDSFDSDTIALFTRRVYDMAGTCGKGLKVHTARLLSACSRSFPTRCTRSIDLSSDEADGGGGRCR